MKNNKKLLVGPEGGPYKPRIYRRSAKGTQAPRILVKCGCCDNSIEIYYDDDEIELNGVVASIEDWREILLPLLVVGSNRGEEKKL